MPAKNISGRSGLLANHAFGGSFAFDLIGGVRFGKTGDRHDTAVADAQPAFPMHARRIADICGAAVRFQLQHLLEVDIIALAIFVAATPVIRETITSEDLPLIVSAQFPLCN